MQYTFRTTFISSNSMGNSSSKNIYLHSQYQYTRNDAQKPNTYGKLNTSKCLCMHSKNFIFFIVFFTSCTCFYITLSLFYFLDGHYCRFCIVCIALRVTRCTRYTCSYISSTTTAAATTIQRNIYIYTYKMKEKRISKQRNSIAYGATNTVHGSHT